MELKPIFELGVAEAYDLLVGRFGLVDLPPLDAIENEDWGRDMLLGRFLEIRPESLADAGLTLEGPPTAEGHHTDDEDSHD
ncbi:MAG: hypothetical protein U0800_11455 [Isosphaeraceae bacterium]